jgi:hypothetical protein
MRPHHLAAAFIVVLSCALLSASCVQSPPAPPETEGTTGGAPAVETADDSDPFGDPSSDPDIGGGIGSEPPSGGVGSDPGSSDFGREPSAGGSEDAQGGASGDEVSEGLAQDACIAAGKAGFDERRAFCNSVMVPPYKKQGCWQRVLLSRAEWIGWCYWNF